MDFYRLHCLVCKTLSLALSFKSVCIHADFCCFTHIYFPAPCSCLFQTWEYCTTKSSVSDQKRVNQSKKEILKTYRCNLRISKYLIIIWEYVLQFICLYTEMLIEKLINFNKICIVISSHIISILYE